MQRNLLVKNKLIFCTYDSTTGWIAQPTKYYIRSTVLGGATVSEAWANGKKGKTFVRAAGTQIARQSAYASDTATLQEAVFFEYTDASGMSQKTTDRLGSAVASGDNGEGPPVEADPMGIKRRHIDSLPTKAGQQFKYG